MPLSTEPSRILQEMERFCAYQERSPFEIRKKLMQKGVSEAHIQWCIKTLVEKNFLHEDRFVQAYIEGKSNIKKWGVNKITAGLRSHRIPDHLIQKNLCHLDKKEDLKHLTAWFEKKQLLLSNESDPRKKKQKMVRFLLGKGFPLDDILSLF